MKLRIEDKEITWTPRKLVIAGYTAKDQEAVKQHIEELKEIGVPAPPRIPMLYDLSPELLQATETIASLGKDESGEAEVVLLDIEGKWYMGLGSDHTDRVLEAHSVQKSKQVCPKPMSQELWPLDQVKDHWDSIELRSWVTVDGEEQLYQEGNLGAFLSPDELLAIIEERGYISKDIAIFCGTLALIGGKFAYGAPFRAELYDPVLQRKITLTYQVKFLQDAEEE